MPALHHLRRAALLLSLCLLLPQSHLRAAALPTGRGQQEEARPGGGAPKDRESPQPEIPPGPPGAEDQKRGGSDEGDLFQDVDPKALAAVLLKALQAEAGKPSSGQNWNPEPSADEERVRSETTSSEAQQEPAEKKAQGPGWEAGEGEGRKEEEEAERSFGEQELGALKSMLEELQRYGSAAKRAEPPQSPPDPQERDDVLRELEEYERLRAHAAKRSSPAAPGGGGGGGEPWAGARKLRQQQHLEHQLLQRRYEELAESRRQAEEARRAAAEEERLADMASDLLLQYLLKDGEDEDEDKGDDDDDDDEDGEDSGIRRKGSGLLFEDEEGGNVAEDKRSNEAPVEDDDDDDDVDPNTIDRLIELSSKLHLPADDVIDLINNVEKKKKELPDVAPAGGKAKGPAGPPLPLPPPPARNKPKKAPAYAVYRPDPRPPQKKKPYYYNSYYYPPADYKAHHHRRLPKQNEAAWNEVLKGDEYPAPKWFPARPDGSYAGSKKISNYISPRTFPPPPYARSRGAIPGPVVPRDEYFDGDGGRAREQDGGDSEDEELQNYLETMLMKRPKAFL